MKKALMIGTALAALVTAPALAEMKPLYASGGWSTHGGTYDNGVGGCVMMAHARDYSWTVMVKFFGDDNRVQINVNKKGWNIPANIEVPIVMGFDSGTFGSTNAGTLPLTRNTFSGLGFAIGNPPDFLEQFAAANKMWFQFPGGNERPWVLDMTGSRDNVLKFVECASIVAQYKPTQPHGNQPATQAPFGSDKFVPDRPRKPGDRTA